MSKRILPFVAMFMVSMGYAQEIQFQQLNSKFDVSEIKQIKGVKVQKMSDLNTVKLISPDKRNKVLLDAKINTHTWDAFKKDEFILRAQIFDIKKLKTFYPNFSNSSLKKAKKLIGEAKNEI